jgi:DAACS family dicarboxylate/amino acid:cation (Na+ or H+) symporter
MPETPPGVATKVQQTDLVGQIFDQVPKSVLGPFGDEGKILSIIFLALTFGIALRQFKAVRIATVSDIVEVGFNVLIVILHWIIEVIPFAVFGIVASIIGKDGFAAFRNLLMFIIAVILALLLQVLYYCLRIRFGSWVNPLKMLSQMKDALLMAFSTSSSTVTMPVTYALLRDKVGLRERSASLGALIGSNFNNDGTALYEAMAALFISQLIGGHLTLQQQGLVVLTSIIASVGAAGIPEAGMVTMTLVFTAVGLPVEYIPLLLATDWFLDRCRTTVNVLGDVTVACLIDGKTQESKELHQPVSATPLVT